MNAATMIVLIIAIVAIAVAVWMYFQKEKTHKLRSKFGSEYDRVVEQEHGNARRAEAVLADRQKRVSKFNLRPLNREECDRFAAEWRRVQELFVDDPRMAVSRADTLVIEALRARGYPMGDFEQRAADISVEHPQVVDNYRAAHDIAQRDQRGQATTEELRRAMQHYRNLFEHVLDTHVTQYEEVHR
jgi:FtsZ-interacting cell division protein ZipA